MCILTDHVNLVFILQDSDTKEEGEEKFVFLKERSTDVAIETEREVLIDVQYALLKIIYWIK